MLPQRMIPDLSGMWLHDAFKDPTVLRLGLS